MLEFGKKYPVARDMRGDFVIFADCTKKNERNGNTAVQRTGIAPQGVDEAA